MPSKISNCFKPVTNSLASVHYTITKLQSNFLYLTRLFYNCKVHEININKQQIIQLKFNNKAKTLVLLTSIWFVISLPLPWIVNNPDVAENSFYTILGIVGIMSIPFIVLGIVWNIKPELTT